MLVDHHVRICMSQVKGETLDGSVFFVERCREACRGAKQKKIEQIFSERSG